VKNNNGNSIVPAIPQDSLIVLREVSKRYKVRKAAIDRLAAERKEAAKAAEAAGNTYAEIGSALGVTAGRAHELINGRRRAA
jgi:DNA-directed RNA polymerase specialized sigma24 family protein